MGRAPAALQGEHAPTDRRNARNRPCAMADTASPQGKVTQVRTRLLAASSATALALGFAPLGDAAPRTTPPTSDAAATEGSAAAPSGDPIIVGSTLSLTGAFGATGVIHQIAGELFVDRLNASGGLLGRPVEWTVLDDESDQAQVTTLYERLISQDQVDLIIGPYATPNILSAVAVAERHGYTMPQHTAVHRPAADLRLPVPRLVDRPDAERVRPEPAARRRREPARAADQDRRGDQPERLDRLHHPRHARRRHDPGMLSIAEERGYEVVDIRYPPGTTDWAPIATQIRDEEPDLLVNNGLGVDPVGLIEAMEQLDYQPPMMFSLFPAPGPPLGLGELSRRPAVGLDLRAERGDARPVPAGGGGDRRRVRDPGRASEGVRTRCSRRRRPPRGTPGRSSPRASRPPAASTSRRSATRCTRTEPRRRSAGSSTSTRRSTTSGRATQGLKQIQDGDWVMVWPAERAAAELRPPAG